MNKNEVNVAMPDVQNSIDHRQIPIQQVGIKAVRYPLLMKTLSNDAQSVVGEWNLNVYLPAEQKGTHMSRFVTLLDEQQKIPMDSHEFVVLFEKMLHLLEAHFGRIEVTFPFFVRKTAPVSGVQSLMDYQVTYIVEKSSSSQKIYLKVVVPITSLCPCSKKISQYGAHNQRSHVTIAAEIVDDLRPEQLIRYAEESASCELWGLLKRPDEKYVTEHAYENPKFVEDLVRDVAQYLNKEEKVLSYILEAENFESIHNHSAYAQIQCDKRVK